MIIVWFSKIISSLKAYFLLLFSIAQERALYTGGLLFLVSTEGWLIGLPRKEPSPYEQSLGGFWGWGGRSWRCLFTGSSVLPAVSSKSIDTFKLYSQACGIPGDPHSTKFFPGRSAGKEYACNAGDPGWIPGLGRSPGEGNHYPLQYSGLENSMDYIVHGVAKSQTRLSDFHFQYLQTTFWMKVKIESLEKVFTF